MSKYNPHAKSVAILDQAWEHVQSVPYPVSARWLFYRLYQDGVYTGKGDYKRFLQLLSHARKQRYSDWRPWTLADDTRQITTQGDGWKDERAWLQAVSEATCNLDHLQSQPAILAVLFEAKAMEAQFRHYLPDAAILSPFRGDPSIPAKWNLAALLAKRWDEYRVPICVIYFGDFDDKGLSIEKTAMVEILDWARLIDGTGEYRWTRGGLSEDQVARYELPLSIEGKGYQWEALTDNQAQEIIEIATMDLIDPDAIVATMKREDAITTRFQSRFKQAFDLAG